MASDGGKWISVNRLWPEDGQVVEAYDEEDDFSDIVIKARFDGSGDDPYFDTSEFGYSEILTPNENVTHWRLPAPPDATR